MPSAVALRLKIERALEGRFSAALTPALRKGSEVAATGVEPVDALLGGGLPVGAISEFAGPATSGRTTLALSFVARRTVEGKVCAWVDTRDALDPESAAANGVRLSQLLWVRCVRARSGKLAVGVCRNGRPKSHEFAELEMALHATDLLLQGGGFAAIVLDLCDVKQEHGLQIPAATWFRFRQAAGRTRCSLLVLGKRAYAQSCAAVVLRCEGLRAETAGGTVLQGFRGMVQPAQERFDNGVEFTRKPPTSAWPVSTTWAVGRRA